MNNQKSLYSFDILNEVVSYFSPCMNDYLYIYDIPNDTYCISENALKRFKVPATTFQNVTETHKLFVYPDDFPMLSEDLNLMVSGVKNEHNMRYRWLGRDGSPIWINCRGRILTDSEGNPYLMVGCINEIGQQQKADNISGLLGATSFSESLNQYITLPDGFILRIGIDDFKNINERLGIEYGDFVLRKVAECINKSVIPGQFVYRVISDEFIIFDTMGSSINDARRLYRNIRSEVDKVVEGRQYEAIYTISGGVVVNNIEPSMDYNAIMRISEFALDIAKKNGKNQLYVFDPEDYTAFLRKRYIRRELRRSVSNNFIGFDLFFQPIVSVGSEKLYAAETLLRYKTETGEAISPMEFIPVLEDTGLIIPVGKWIIRNALAVCVECQKVCPEFKVSINLSYIQLLKSPIFYEILNSLEASGLSPSSLIVELTESGQLENTPAIQNIWHKLKDLGVNIAIDDFGTGYSNLQNIGNLRPNIVKLDRSFTVKALQNEYEHELMIHIIQMVHSIGLSLVVEGVETNDECIKISSLNPDFIQGYYYSKPCPKAEFMEKFNLNT